MEFESCTAFFERHESAFMQLENHASIAAHAMQQPALRNSIGINRKYLFRYSSSARICGGFFQMHPHVRWRRRAVQNG
jgi:hypothetical protein